MTTPTPVPTTAELLKYADLQMAAEAFLRVNKIGDLIRSGSGLINALKAGNDHSSKFTETQAKAFAEHWTVLDQRANTSTGFSGTLFKCILSDPTSGAQKDEIVRSFRSMEFADDNAWDNKATNAMELKETGFTWGQLRDMEAWYQELKSDPAKLGSQHFSVTGYSLGGHLATASNTMYAAAKKTFNGTGMGKIKMGNFLTGVMAEFSSLPSQGSTGRFTDTGIGALYRDIRGTLHPRLPQRRKSKSGGEALCKTHTQHCRRRA